MNWTKLGAVSLCVAAGCGGKLTVDRYDPGASGSASSSDLAGSSSGGVAGNGGTHDGSGGDKVSGANVGASAGTSAQAGLSAIGGGDVSGEAGAVTSFGGDEATGGAGAAGANGGDGFGPVPCAELVDVDGDCHSLKCDHGVGASLVDQADVPAPDSPCVVGTCNAAGKPGTAPRDARDACHTDDGGALCDGAGACVECLVSADCPEKQSCAKDRRCGPAPCTDVDCGGACPACDDGKKCLEDSDCASYACDFVSHICVADHCKDHHQNLNETDADCGGGICGGCALGQGCFLDFDCASQACDGVSLTCVAAQCGDHRQDAQETDVDCGGGACGACAIGKKCKSDYDCLDGFCLTGTPHLCE